MRPLVRVSVRGLTPQLFLLVVLPLAGLLLTVTFGGVALHRSAMRQMVEERDQRAVQAAAQALSEQLDQRLIAIQGLAVQLGGKTSAADIEHAITQYDFLQDNFDAGLAAFSDTGQLLAYEGEPGLWQAFEPAVQAALAEPLATGPRLSSLVTARGQAYLLFLATQPGSQTTAAGALTPANLIGQTLAQATGGQATTAVFVIDPAGQVLYRSGQDPGTQILSNHPGVAEALAGGSGADYLDRDQEHVVAYSYVPVGGWALVMEEPWESVATPLLRLTEYAPLVLLPILGLSLLAVWFGTRSIIQPLLRLQARASRLGWGDHRAIEEPVGGISEIRQLQNELVHLARKLQAAQQGLRDYIGAMTAGQEEERRRLARELHDDTLQTLIGLNQRAQLLGMRLEQAAQNCDIPPEIARDVLDLQSLAEGSIANLRRLTRALRPIYLEDLGLATALEMLAQETSHPERVVHFELSERLPRMEPQVELAVYRMVQEALSNITRHSEASEAWLSVSTNGKNARITVRDNGRGFDVPESPAAFAPSGHFGLLGLHERAEMIGARLEIQSESGQGTRVKIDLPVPKSAGQLVQE